MTHLNPSDLIDAIRAMSADELAELREFSEFWRLVGAPALYQKNPQPWQGGPAIIPTYYPPQFTYRVEGAPLPIDAWRKTW